jgi:hypothetical protein
MHNDAPPRKIIDLSRPGHKTCQNYSISSYFYCVYFKSADFEHEARAIGP